MPSDPTTLSRFKGLNNVADPMRGTRPGTEDPLTWEWQSVADNVDGTDNDRLTRREGYQQFIPATGISGSYSTFDYSRCYIIDSGTLKQVNHDGTTRTLYGTLSGVPFWSEVNDVIYLSCEADKLQVHADGSIRRWGVPTPIQPTVDAVSGSLYAGTVQVAFTYTDEFGREGGASPSAAVTVGENGGVAISGIPATAGYRTNVYATESDGTVFYFAGSFSGQTAYTLTHMPHGPELTTQFLDEVPENAKYVAALGANLYASEYVPELDQTVVWSSEALGYHLFNLNSNYFLIPGEVTQMYGAKTGLLVTTHNRTFVYNNDKLDQVAEYGAVPGQHADLGADEKIYFWTKRGLCRVMPFENLTETRVSVAPGVYAGGGIVERGGYKKYVAVIHQGGDAFNRR